MTEPLEHADLAGMSPEEVNRRWDEVEAVLRAHHRGGDAGPAPVDTRRLPPDHGAGDRGAPAPWLTRERLASLTLEEAMAIDDAELEAALRGHFGR